MQLKDFLDEDENQNSGGNPHGSKPIADLFPEATVLFADIAGFTAWSSVREPCQVSLEPDPNECPVVAILFLTLFIIFCKQVFTLLETVYHAFDEIAKRRRVFKVETIGDCKWIGPGLIHARRRPLSPFFPLVYFCRLRRCHGPAGTEKRSRRCDGPFRSRLSLFNEQPCQATGASAWTRHC